VSEEDVLPGRPVKIDGVVVGWAEVMEGRVTNMVLQEGFMLALPRGEHEVVIELDPIAEVDKETGDLSIVFEYLSSKFTL
jgi:hypothetical protein